MKELLLTILLLIIAGFTTIGMFYFIAWAISDCKVGKTRINAVGFPLRECIK